MCMAYESVNVVMVQAKAIFFFTQSSGLDLGILIACLIILLSLVHFADWQNSDVHHFGLNNIPDGGVNVYNLECV